MEELQSFRKMTSELPNSLIKAWEQDGKPVVGTVCSNIPEEILHAAGVLPIRVRAPGLQETSIADSHLHRLNCSYTRSVLELLLRGELDFMSGIITTNTCDHMLRLASELADKGKFDFIHNFSIHHTIGEAAEEWFTLEMKKMMQRIEEVWGINISDEKLRRSISVYNRTRELMSSVYEMRKKNPPTLSGVEYMWVLLAGMSMPKELFNEHLEVFLPMLKERQIGDDRKLRLMLVGGAFDSPEFVDGIEQKGAYVVADGLCFGMRYYQGMIDEDQEDPLEAIAAYYVGRIVCPSIINGFDHNYKIFKGIIDDWDVHGVISARLKFCDHWACERKMLTDEFRNIGLPILDLEREYNTTWSGQINTRVQAFLEILGGKIPNLSPSKIDGA